MARVEDRPWNQRGEPELEPEPEPELEEGTAEGTDGSGGDGEVSRITSDEDLKEHLDQMGRHDDDQITRAEV